MTFERIEASWRSALAAAQSAIQAAASVGAGECAELTRRLAAERASTFDLLEAVAQTDGRVVKRSRVDAGLRNGGVRR